MAAIQQAAMRSEKDRKNADLIRIKAGHMLTFDHLVNSQEISERQIARKVLRKSMLRSTGCLPLPLTIAYFGFYITSVRLHEDITNVFFLESTLRDRLDAMFTEANTVEDVWDVLTSAEPGKFTQLFFNHRDMYGDVQQRNITQDIWGDWGLVLGYNQIQGAVQFEQWRKTTGDFGKSYNCTSAISCDLCRSNEGLQTIKNTISRPPLNIDCGSWSADRRLDADVAGAAEAAEVAARQEAEDFLAGDDFHPRRLHVGRPELRSSLPQTSGQEVNDTFRFWLYPAETEFEVLQRLHYFKDRSWIDQDTEAVEIRMYLMNAELGRNRLEQLTITLRFSEAGSVYYERDLQCYFLQFFFGNASMMADGMFFLMLLLNTAYRLHGMWKAFLQSKLFVHLLNLHTGWEWLMILTGWWTMYGYYNMMFVWEPALLDALKPVHTRGWELGPSRIEQVEQLFAQGEKAVEGLASLRVVVAQYSVMLMFRFFFSFGSQPRLAIVLKTMQNVLTDLCHFLIVFVPTAFAYVIAGSLIFGRRIEGFTTITSSFGTCFRIAMESEYDWAEMSAEFFGAAALWAWSFLSLVVLLFLNMVLAIILDIYNETRQKSFPGEAIWETVGYFMMKGYRFRSWVPDKKMDEQLEQSLDYSMIDMRFIEEHFPKMPREQQKAFFEACRSQMKWESTKDLTKPNLLKLIGSVMDSLQTSHQTVTRVVKDESKNPIKPWVTPQSPQKGKDEDHHSFLKKQVVTKGGKQPNLEKQGAHEDMLPTEDSPEWLQETWELLRQQRQWIEYTNHNLQQMQWQIQRAIESRPLLHESDDKGADSKVGVL